MPLVARKSRRVSPASRRAQPNGKVRLGVLADFIAFHLLIAQNASFRAFARHAGQSDLKPGRFGAMMVIHNNPGMTQAALGRAVSRDKSTITPLVQELHRRGFIHRNPSAVDRRSVTLRLTRSGEAALKELLAHARAHDRRLDDVVGKRKPTLLALLRKIADELG